MGRHRLHLDNAARQRAYREREKQKHPLAPVIVPDYFDETDGRSCTLRSFVHDVVNSRSCFNPERLPLAVTLERI
jgi:hypothetical protein